MSDFCRDNDRPCLAPTTTILPAGGSGKKSLPLATMAVAEGTKVVLLVDNDRAGRGTVTLLNRELPGAVATVRTHEDSEQTDRELEDLFAPSTFVQLVNVSHSAVAGYKPLQTEELDVNKPICDAIKDRFVANGLGAFQKMRPAMEIQKRRELNEIPDVTTLDQFGNLFERLNEALKQS
jgi:hypothetical protein